MSRQFEVYKCEKCPAVVEVLQAGAGAPVCCGAPMRHLVEGVADAAREKHVPVAEKSEAGLKITVGAVPHPMEEQHHIAWVEILGDDFSCKRFLRPGDKPQAEFRRGCSCGGKVTAREYCNLHGLWKTEL